MDGSVAEKTLRSIPFLHTGATIIPINKGYSGDHKYRVMQNGSSYLLRIFDGGLYRNKQTEFEVLKTMEAYGVKCSRPLEIGRLPDAGLGYYVLTYIEGADAEDQLPLYSAEDQYRIGYGAGNELRIIHQCKAPPGMSSWAERKTAKHRRYMEEYDRLGQRIRGGDKVMEFIESRLPLMKESANLLQHDDFHTGNLIVQDRRLAGIIDFNRLDFGDPVHEFIKVGLFSSEVSHPFCIGQIKGYHQGQEPDEMFWQLYSLYMAMALISSVVWSIKFVPEETDGMMARIHRVMEDHAGFGSVRPKWYIELSAAAGDQRPDRQGRSAQGMGHDGAFRTRRV
ncbi:Predicted kinase, aminoglycoside phosphotransferase (APT) family [Paenibacillus sophorae]|uniref:Phosphotransferase n=1 Tax=Paenibacillus sophorae TaxID=1333845 RepID=A0A1H8K126_9BACL|nr:phosphotransferase [Paenibacillus sophorae]QWU13551.1 phosphotransferase [Paenibacillus sophorae]SEN86387.1 Predicted kinase, aminoglycoside phosphotransferase (APT) family [Paenibacillus sophorae]